MVCNLFGKQLKRKGALHQRLADELHKPYKTYSSFMDNIWGVNLAAVLLTSNCRKRILFFCVCAMDGSSKYRWVIPLKYKKNETITKAFQNISD